ncbi:MAG: restriction endonuclease subunit S [Proteobacteria bacterium]|nr:restriction endonuclease subunit S [Pseudomonadota bacterium]
MSRLVAIGDLVENSLTWNPTAAVPEETFEYIDLSSVDREQKRITGAETVLCGSAPSRARQLVKSGDVLVSTVRPNLNGVAMVPSELDGATASTGFTVLRARADRVDRSYLFHWVKNPRFIEDMVSKATGASYPAVSDRIVRESLIPLPELPEQRRIAAILDKADALRAKRREAIAKLDQLLQSVFLDMFGDPVENPKQWPKESLAGLFYIARGGSPRPIDAYITEATDGVNWIMIGDTVDGSKYIDGTRKKIRKEGVVRSRMVRPGDFLLTNSMSFGRPYILRTSGCIHDGWLVLSPKGSRTSQDYLHSVLSSRSIYAEFARRAPGATVKNLNIDLVSGVEVPVPPIEMQAVFADAVRQIELHGQRLQTQADEIDTFFASLQYRAFAGTL